MVSNSHLVGHNNILGTNFGGGASCSRGQSASLSRLQVCRNSSEAGLITLRVLSFLAMLGFLALLDFLALLLKLSIDDWFLSFATELIVVMGGDSSD